MSGAAPVPAPVQAAAASSSESQPKQWVQLHCDGTPEEIRKTMIERYTTGASNIWPNLNFIKARVVKVKGGYRLEAVHDFFSQYSFSAGAGANEISTWIDRNSDCIKRAEIKQVGVWGAGSYASGVWFNVPQ